MGGKGRLMRRGPKSAKSKEAKVPVGRKAPKSDGARVRDLEKRLAEARGQLQTRDRELAESREQQAATAEILRVISSSPSDVQPVFEAIVSSAKQLVGAYSAAVLRLINGELHLVASSATTPLGDEAFRAMYPLPLTQAPVLAQAIRDRAPLPIEDPETEPRITPLSREMARQRGYRSTLMLPLVQRDGVIGVIGTSHAEPRTFSSDELALLQTFADQAVIAIENVRLFNETKEALEQQTATSEILRVISSSPTDAQPVFDAIVQSARRLLSGHGSSLTRIVGNMLHLQAFITGTQGGDDAARAVFPIALSSNKSVHSRAVRARAPAIVTDVETDPMFETDMRAMARKRGYRSVMAVPLLREGEPIGAISVTRPEAGSFTDKQIALLQTFADQAVIAVENVRLFTELQTSNRELTTALDKQTATADILRVISQSQTSVEPVFDTIISNAVQLCSAVNGGLYQFDGERLHVGAACNFSGAGWQQWLTTFPRPLSDGGGLREVVETGLVLNVGNIDEYSRFTPAARDLYHATGIRSSLFVPLARQEQIIGVIAVNHRNVDAFTDTHIELLKTFADQAVIAIENVRLFNETKEALERQTATSDILRVIASSPTELQPVLDAMAESVARLCAVYDAVIWRLEGDGLRSVAHHGPVGSLGDRVVPVHRGTVTGRTVLDRQTVHLTDLQAEVDEFPEGSAFARQFGHRSIVSVPLLREGVAIGVMSLRRAEIQPFTEKQIDLLKTFADQAVIAIENVRLFRQLEARNRDLTATSAILQVISSSPTDAQPVFDAIAQSALRLCEGSFSNVIRYDGDLLHHVAGAHVTPAGADVLRQVFPLRPSRATLSGRVVLDRVVVHVRDMQTDPDYIRTLAEAMRVGSGLAVPMLREGQAVGCIAVGRLDVRLFTAEQVALLQTFADQAVIAIENVPLLP